MKVAVSLFQKNNSRHLLEYFAWYHMLGVDTFLVFDHHSTDKSIDLIQKLANYYDIRLMKIGGYNAGIRYWDYIFQYRSSGEFDWIISADADEFYVPTEHYSIKEFLAPYMSYKISCLGVYWLMFGNNGNINWEPGLVTECYTRRAPLKHLLNHHMKSILRCGDSGGNVWFRQDGHCLGTEFGTYDTDGRLITTGLNRNSEITHSKIRINHYWAKSLEFFKNVKQVVGQQSDRLPGSDFFHYPSEYWYHQNFNDEKDTLAWDRFGDRLKISYENMRNQIGMKAKIGYDY